MSHLNHLEQKEDMWHIDKRQDLCFMIQVYLSLKRNSKVGSPAIRHRQLSKGLHSQSWGTLNFKLFCWISKAKKPFKCDLKSMTLANKILFQK